uniref:Uncharacterized protein n=1 Tax=Triticum urartu TaxID=4572 RepID=A0A8R7PFD7_TRIUA
MECLSRLHHALVVRRWSAVEAEGPCVLGAGGSRRHSRVSGRWPGTLVPSSSWPTCSLEEACVITCESKND